MALEVPPPAFLVHSNTKYYQKGVFHHKVTGGAKFSTWIQFQFLSLTESKWVIKNIIQSSPYRPKVQCSFAEGKYYISPYRTNIQCISLENIKAPCSSPSTQLQPRCRWSQAIYAQAIERGVKGCPRLQQRAGGGNQASALCPTAGGGGGIVVSG